MAAAKSVSEDVEPKKGDNLKTYVMIAAVLVFVAIASTVLTIIPSGGNGCGQQDYNCMQQLAESASNASTCTTLPTYYSDECYATVADNTQNAALCSKISDPNVTGECLTYIANATKNPTLCERVDPQLMQGCVEQVAITLMSPNACLEIADKVGRNTCLSSIYLSEAIEHSNQSYCARITSNNDSNLTFASLGLLNNVSESGALGNLTEVVNYASFSNTTLGLRDLCYMDLAYASMDKSYCSSVSQNMSTICNSTAEHFNTVSYNSTEIANFTAFMNLCNQEANSSQCNDTAEYLQAMGAMNVTSCVNLTAVYSYQCYYTLAQRYNSTKYCSYISNSTLNGECIDAITSPDRNNIYNTSGQG